MQEAGTDDRAGAVVLHGKAYLMAGPRILYVVIETRAMFDAIALEQTEHEKLFVKTAHAGEQMIIFQLWKEGAE